MSKLHVIKFEAPWCSICKQVQPALDNFVAEGSITLDVVDVEEYPQAAKDAGVRSLPSFIIYQSENGSFDPNQPHVLVTTLGAIKKVIGETYAPVQELLKE